MSHPAETEKESWLCSAVRVALGWKGTRVVLGLLVVGTMMAVGQVQARGYTSIIIDAETGQVLQQNDADAYNYPASLTK